MTKSPRVSIGLPVYNGEDLVTPEIESILAQTFTDFELIICDNASTDRTGDICREFAARDPRVRYFRNEKNVGLVRNYNLTLEHATAEFFKWTAHDDVHLPTYLEKCLQPLERDPDVVLSYSRALVVGDNNEVLRKLAYPLDTSLARLRFPEERFRDILWFNIGSPAIFGITRTNVLRQTPGLGGSHAGDQVLLAELALRGKFAEVPEDLMLLGEHSNRSVYANPSRHALAQWLVPSRQGKIIFPAWSTMYDYDQAIRRSPLNAVQRLKCRKHLARWAVYHSDELLQDVTKGIVQFVASPFRASRAAA